MITFSSFGTTEDFERGYCLFNDAIQVFPVSDKIAYTSRNSNEITFSISYWIEFHCQGNVSV